MQGYCKNNDIDAGNAGLEKKWKITDGWKINV